MLKRFIEWLDDRLGVVEFYNKHIAYPITDDVTFWHYFGGLTIGCIIIQFITGFYMLWYYIPEPDLAHQSIRDMANNTDFGALFRNVHRWSSTVATVFLGVHVFHVLARRAYRPPRELNWWTGMALAFLFILLLITGIIMPWDWRSYWELIIWADWIDTIPGIGGLLKGPFLSWFSLGRNFSMHIILLPVMIVGLIVIHLILFRRLGPSEKV